MKVRATATGFYGGERKREGAVFEVKDGAKSKWFVPVDASKPAPAKAPKAKAEPATLSELAKSVPAQEQEVI